MSKIENKTNIKENFVLGLRFGQFLATSLFIIGLIWGSSDFISTLLPKDSPIAPLSVLFMLYGFVGSLSIEAVIRIVQRKKE